MSNNQTFHSCGSEITESNYEGCVPEIDDPYDDGNFWVVCQTHDQLIRTVEVRKATVNAKNVGWGSDPLQVVNAYLPRTFNATQDDDVITIVGTDEAGWTLDGYVIPRLASAMIYATEVV